MRRRSTRYADRRKQIIDDIVSTHEKLFKSCQQLNGLDKYLYNLVDQDFVDSLSTKQLLGFKGIMSSIDQILGDIPSRIPELRERLTEFED